MNVRQRGRQSLRSLGAHGQSRHLARLHRSGLHRSHRHRLQPRRGAGRPGEKALLLHHARYRVSFARHLRLAGQEWPPGLAQIPRRRKLRRIPRSAHHPLPAVAAWRGHERRGAGFALSQPGREQQWRSLAAALDDDPAVHHRGAPGARKQTHSRSHGGRDRLHARASTQPRSSRVTPMPTARNA